MGKFSGYLLACDIDGTLVENNYINPKNIEKINYFTQQGGIFSIATGRSVGAIDVVLKNLNCISASVVSNGCMIYDYKLNKVLHQSFIPNIDKFTVKTVYEKYSKIGIEVHSGDKVYAVRRSKESNDHQDYELLDAQDILIEDVMKINWNKIVLFMNDDIENAESIMNILSNMVKRSIIINTSAMIDGKLRLYIEQLPTSISKASGIIKLLDIYKIPTANLFAIGDYYNDLEMIKMAKVGACTMDSPMDIKEHSQYIACSCNDGAVADFIDYLDNIY